MHCGARSRRGRFVSCRNWVTPSRAERARGWGCLPCTRLFSLRDPLWDGRVRTPKIKGRRASAKHGRPDSRLLLDASAAAPMTPNRFLPAFCTICPFFCAHLRSPSVSSP